MVAVEQAGRFALDPTGPDSEHGARPARLSWEVRRRATLTPSDIDGMYRIHTSLYADTDVDTFRADLAEKDHVVLLTDPLGAVRGYTTLRVYADAEGWVLFSGDTGVDREAWGSSALHTGWLAAAMEAYQERGPLDWLLLAGGPRTYRYLPLFFRAYWPSPFAETPAHVERRLVALAAHRYGARFRNGIVRLGAGGLRPEHDQVRPNDPVDTFFRARNPGFAAGDELACLTRIAPDNFAPAAQRVLARLGR